MRVAMLYTWDWSHEFKDHEAGLVPAHRLFGAAELPGLGVRVATCKWSLVPQSFRHPQAWKVWQAFWVMFRQTRLECVVATTEASALPVLALRLIGIVRRPVVVLSVATLTDKYLHGRGGALRRRLLRQASCVVVYASAQVAMTSDRIGVPPERVRFIPFGVDVEFFSPRTAQVKWDVVSVGTNEGKDFPTLVSALSSEMKCLIVTDYKNAEQALGTATDGTLTVDQHIPIIELRGIYASARRHVIPLRDVPFSSGQTVLLENLAMGRPVVVSETAATRDYVSAEVATLVPPGDAGAMRLALLSSPPSFVAAATEHVRRHFTSERFAADLATLCREIVASPSRSR